MHLPSFPVLVLAVAIGVATIVVVSAYGAEIRLAACAGLIAAAAILAWGMIRERDEL